MTLRVSIIFLAMGKKIQLGTLSGYGREILAGAISGRVWRAVDGLRLADKEAFLCWTKSIASSDLEQGEVR